MYCRNCGAQIPDGAGFCPACGAAVQRSQPNQPQYSPYQQPPKKNNTGIIIGAIAAVAIVVVAIIVCFTVLTRGKQETQLAQIQAQQQIELQEREDAKAAEEEKKAAEEAEEDEDEAVQETAKKKTSSKKKSKKTQTVVTNEEPAETDGGDTITYNYYYYGHADHYSGDYYTAVKSSGYLWPTDTQYITSADLSNYDHDTVDAIRNEIYARHGYAFTKARWQDYFGSKSWYSRNPYCNADTADSYLTSIEKANVDTIVAYESARGWY